MKNVLSLFAALFIFVAVGFAQTSNVDVKFKAEAHNFGKVPQGTPVTHEFTFTNNSKTPIVIENVQSTCGCTVPSWTKSPILPGQSGSVAAQYNAASMGNFKKPVTVYYKVGDEKREVKLFLEGEVVDKNAASGVPAKNDMFKK